jgi:hypothetical protein
VHRFGGLLLAGAVSIGAPVPSLGQGTARSDEPPDRAGYINFVWENDVFGLGNTDGHYTNGLRLSYLTGQDRVWWWLANAAKATLFSSDANLRASFGLGHNMYTPEDISDPEPILNDRPYAAWLYATLGLIGESGKNLDFAALSLGVVGPAAGGEGFQKFIHEIIGSPEPQGWDNQLGNEIIIQAFYEHLWRDVLVLEHPPLFQKLGIEFDFLPHLAGALGNAYVYGAAGLTMRLGNDLPSDFGPPRIRPSLPGSEFFVPSRAFGWYLFAGFEMRAIARNLFIEGNTFRESLSVEKHLFVGDLQLGATLAIRAVRVSFTYVFRSKEFTEQRRADQFGALSLSVRVHP